MLRYTIFISIHRHILFVFCLTIDQYDPSGSPKVKVTDSNGKTVPESAYTARFINASETSTPEYDSTSFPTVPGTYFAIIEPVSGSGYDGPELYSANFVVGNSSGSSEDSNSDNSGDSSYNRPVSPTSQAPQTAADTNTSNNNSNDSSSQNNTNDDAAVTQPVSGDTAVNEIVKAMEDTESETHAAADENDTGSFEPIIILSDDFAKPITGEEYMKKQIAKQSDDGALENTTSEEDNFGGMSLDTDANDLKEVVLTEKDLQAVSEGNKVQVFVESKEIKITQNQKKQIEEKFLDVINQDPGLSWAFTAQDVVLGEIFDASLIKKVGNGPAEQVHNTSGDVELTFEAKKVPQARPGYRMKAVATTVHGGKFKQVPVKIAAYKGANNTAKNYATIKVGEFSLFAIFYLEEPIPVDTETDKEISVDTGDQTSHTDAGNENPHTGTAGECVVLMTVAGAGAFFSRKKRKNSK